MVLLWLVQTFADKNGQMSKTGKTPCYNMYNHV